MPKNKRSARAKKIRCPIFQPRRRTGLAAAVASLLGAAGAAYAETNLYWGDLHVHSNYSTDAYSTGNRTVTPDMAYRFARGFPIPHPTLNENVEIGRPLDFLAVTDHAINLGRDPMLDDNHPVFQATEGGRLLLEARARGEGIRSLTPAQREQVREDTSTPEVRRAAWADEVEAAEDNYVPGEFTTFVGWEWTAMPRSEAGILNLHRCVISNADGETGNAFIPLNNADTIVPEELYAWLTETQERTGVDFVAIPHNSNLSGGLMFDEVDSEGRPITSEYARMRARWEPLVEITQTKGTSEVHPDLSPTDEFAEFEIRRKLLAGAPTPADSGDYVRSALLRGLFFESSIGANPYKFGVVGSTDNHSGTSTVDESNFLGKLAVDADLEERANTSRRVIFPAWEMSAGGLTGVWAEENTRESLFAALKRKEVYATTGTRISLRVFGGFEFRPEDAEAANLAEIGYERGVPMGSDLSHAPEGQAPALLIHAAMDPMGAHLDRVQVIKGWVDDNGETHEEIYDAAWSGDRMPGADGELAPVGNTVDVRTATYENTIGAPQFKTVWTDPDFRPDQNAFYYVRVIEIPTPRHSLYDAVALGIDVAETDQPATIQERAYSSAIWYTPAD